jgi:hypothetical protein
MPAALIHLLRSVFLLVCLAVSLSLVANPRQFMKILSFGVLELTRGQIIAWRALGGLTAIGCVSLLLAG